MHIISHGLTPLIKLISLNEGSRKWIILFEFEVSGGLIVTKGTCYGEIFWSSIEYNFSGLRFRRAHINCSHINGVISTGEGYLKCQIIFVILRGVCNFRDQLLFSHPRLNLNWFLSVHVGGDTLVELYFGFLINFLNFFAGDLEKGIDGVLHLGEGLANVRVLHIPKLSIIINFNMNLIIFFGFFQFLDFMMRNKVLFKLNSQYFLLLLLVDGFHASLIQKERYYC